MRESRCSRPGERSSPHQDQESAPLLIRTRRALLSSSGPGERSSPHQDQESDPLLIRTTAHSVGPIFT
ncbi:hypothetical protein NHX12_001009 [Muraenolepis orangiensis]|uniref:Uncharacterized protein n=1 Tax=Muraenolepis orangiensis TaxID=630683 RepID=A0A9Q0DZN2_9TELE|nr:hypothetical protein NHX12_001009 [Muraenolepis orangiensis]